MKEHIQAIVTVLSLVNPAICGMLFAQGEAGISQGKQLVDATKAAISEGAASMTEVAVSEAM